MTAVCQTPDDAYAAGYQAAAELPPLTRDQAVRIALAIAASRKPKIRAA